MAASALFGSLGNLGEDYGDAIQKNKAIDLNTQNVQSEIAARAAATKIASEQHSITYKDPSSGGWKKYNPITMQITDMPEGFDPTYNPATDPEALLKRAENAYGGPLPEPVRQRIIAHASGGVNLPTTSALKQEPDPASTTGWSWVRRDPEGNEVSRSVAAPPVGFVPQTTNTTQTDPLGLTTTTKSTKTRTVPGATLAPAASGGTGGNSALATVVKGAGGGVTGNPASSGPAPVATPKAGGTGTGTSIPAAAPGLPDIDTGKMSPLEKNMLPMALDWQNRGIKPPEKYVGMVTNLMQKYNLVPMTEETVAYKNARSAILDVMPLLDKLQKDLEPQKDVNSYLASAKQFGKFMNYQYLGQKPDNENDADIMQIASFAKIAAAAPWAKIGRGKYIYEQVQKHLPNPAMDSPANMYDKTIRLKQIFQDELQRSPSRSGDAWAGYPGSETALGKVVQSNTPQAKARAILDEADRRAAQPQPQPQQ